MGFNSSCAESKEKMFINDSPKLHLYDRLLCLHKDVSRLSFVLLLFCSKAAISGFTYGISAAGNFSDFV